MTPVIAPLLLGNTGSEVLNLQQALLELYHHGYVQNAEPILGEFITEASRSFFGSATNAFVQRFCITNDLPFLPETPVYDVVAQQINALLQDVAADQPYPVTVQLETKSGKGLDTSVTVDLYCVKSLTVPPGSSDLIASQTADSSKFQVRFEVSRDQILSDQGVYGLQAIVSYGAIKYRSEVGYPETEALTLNLSLDDRVPVRTEFDTLYSGLIEGHIIDNAPTHQEADAPLLAKRVGEPEAYVRLFIRALNFYRTSTESSHPEPNAAFWYGLFRQNISAEPAALLHTPPAILLKALQASVANGIIDPADTTVFEHAIAQMPAALTRMLSGAELNENAMLRIIRDAVGGNTDTAAAFYSAHYASIHAADDHFWTETLPASVPGIGPYIPALRAALQLTFFVGANPALIHYLLMVLENELPDISSLAVWNLNQWVSDLESLSISEDFLLPDFIPGEGEQRLNEYANRILQGFKGAFPTAALAAELAADETQYGGNQYDPFANLRQGLEFFLAANDDFDFRTVSMDALQNGSYDLEGVMNPSEFIEDIGTVQRLMNLTVDYKPIVAMASNGFVSSLHIVQASAQDFTNQLAAHTVGEEAAAFLYDMAEATTLYNTVLAMEYFQQLSDTDSFVFNREEDEDESGNGSQSGNQQSFAMLRAGDSTFAEWRSLFGPLDSCTCSHCMSVYSPAAYMVDLLRFLRGDSSAGMTLSLHDHLLGKIQDPVIPGRRPDIKHLELTCKNTNTPVPYIDLVNELLEDLVEAPGGAYQLFARQTGADAARQRAIPEHVKTGIPYQKLKNAIYPWALPYNFYKRQIDTHLGIAGIKGYELIQRFGRGDSWSSTVQPPLWNDDPMAIWSDIDFCAQYLGISKRQKELIITEVPSSGNYIALLPYYGLRYNGNTTGNDVDSIPDPEDRGQSVGMTTQTWIGVLTSRVDLFLQQSGLTYRELLQLRDCYYINPTVTSSTRMFEIDVREGAAPDTCDLSMLQIIGMNGDILSRLYRFVRLKRAMGCTYYELDNLLMDILPKPPTSSATTTLSTLRIPLFLDAAAFVRAVQVKRLVEQLGCRMEDLVLFKDYGPTNTDYGQLNLRSYRDYDKAEPEPLLNQYDRLFRNPLLPDIEGSDYPIVALFPSYSAGGPAEINDASLYDHLSGVLGLPATEVAALTQLEPIPLYPGTTTNKKALTVPWLARLHGRATMIKGLGLTVAEWISYQTWLMSTVAFDGLTTASPIYYPDYTNSPYAALRFVSYVKMVQESGLSIAEVEYLLRDNAFDALEDDARNERLTAALTGLRDGLLQKWHPAYTQTMADNDADGKGLEGIVRVILDAEKAARLTELLKKTAAYTTAEQDFIATDLHFFLPQGIGPVPPGGSLTPRRQAVYNAFVAYQTETVYKPFVNAYLAKELKLKEAMVVQLLTYGLLQGTTGNTTNGYTSLLASDFIAGNHTIVRWGTTAAPVAASVAAAFRTLLQLDKASLLAIRFKLDVTDADFLWGQRILPGILQLVDLPVRDQPRPTPSGGTATVTPFIQLAMFLRWMPVRAFLKSDMTALYQLLAVMTTTSKADMEKQLCAIFKMPASDLAYLLDELPPPSNITNGTGRLRVMYVPGSYAYWRQPGLYQRLIDCLEMQALLLAPMQTLGKMTDSVFMADNQDDADVVIQLVRVPYNDAQWMKTVRPVNDLLRAERRDALVAYLLANPPSGYKGQWFTDNDLFETLLIDVEMMPCMSTTRILQAINAIQLWVDRIALRLERDGTTTLTMNPRQQRQWQTWRKLYRVWEANRKIFLYPENWIEPELRDGKTPAFQELEKYFRQNEVTPENVEEAYRTYLDRLNEVAHLDVVGMYRETTQAYSTFNPINNDVLHVFGRTPASPHLYYYRRRSGGEWTPWEKMDVQIASDHVLPVMWRGRLRLYWLMFTKDQSVGTAAALRLQSEKYVTPDPTRWKIELAWTEYQHGVWSAAQIGKEAIYSDCLREEEPISKDHVGYFSYAHEGVWRVWNFKGAMDYQQRFNINWYCKIDSDGNPRFMLTERTRDIQGIGLNHWVHSPTNANKPNPLYGQPLPKVVASIKSDDSYWDRTVLDLGYFTAKYNGIIATQLPLKPATDQNLYSSAANLDLTNNGFGLVATDYEYQKPTNQGYSHYPDNGTQLIGNAPGTDVGKVRNKYLVFPRQVPQGHSGNARIEIPYFFYKDADNSFFVERVANVTVQVSRFVAIMASPYQTSPMPFSTRGVTPSISLSGLGNINATKTQVSTTVSRIPVSRFNTIEIGKYRFHNYRHIRVDAFLKQLYEKGVDGLLNRDFVVSMTDSLNFNGQYKPTPYTVTPYPVNSVDFAWDSAYAAYNWELFYHIPVFIANKLSQNQQFEEARRWYHYVFNPTVNQNTSRAEFWNFYEFYKNANNTPTPLQVMQDVNLQQAVDRWADNPFKPHLVARTRVSAYMKNTVMKYLDNLIAWGDDLFRRDSREAINEATLLYVLAAQLLGRRPETVPARATPVVQTYNSISTNGSWNAFGNALVRIENILLASGATMIYNPATRVTYDPSLKGSMYYFCLPPNDKLKAYWDLLADRFFKIRNCRTIDGVERELALFDPPIDPALLVKAAAAGLSLSDVLAELNAPLPLYRFNTMAQKASELAGEVKSLGGQLLSALEKRDAEALVLLRSNQEQTVLQAATEVREKGIEESARQIESLMEQQKNTVQRRDHYKRLVDTGLNGFEQQQLDSLSASIPLSIAQGVTQTLASAMFAIPEIHLGPFIIGARAGGQNIGNLISAASSAIGTVANVNNIRGSMAATKGGFARRKEEWELQFKVSDIELRQLDKQIAAAEIRKAMAEAELRNHRLQIRNAAAMYEAMQDKFTNEELYEWMISQLSLTYFEAYKLACDVAKRAERCYRFELGLATSDFIQPGYWSNLKKGLLAGEQLHHDIRRMEVAYLEKNKRSLELTKHVSLATFAPEALAALRSGSGCSVDLPEWLFDMDYPGQHLRRIKSVSVSIPCVAGPYTTVSCKLSLVKSKYRIDATSGGGTWEAYRENPEGDARFAYQFGNIQSIATSSAQNDSGMFELNFRDERYLPFEGAGAVSNWRIELPAACAQFDYSTISDLILHVKYTAIDGGALKEGAKGLVAEVFRDAVPEGGLTRIFNLRQDFPNEWQAYHSAYAGGDMKAALVLKTDKAQFPFFVQGQKVAITDWTVYVSLKDENTGAFTVELLNSEGNAIGLIPFGGTPAKYRHAGISLAVPVDGSTVGFRIKQGSAFKKMDAFVQDLYLVAGYKTVASSVSYPTEVVRYYTMPGGLKSHMLAWWKADSGVVTATGTSAVTKWQDASAGGHNLQPNQSSLAPALSTTLVDGVAPVVFNGGQSLLSNDFADTNTVSVVVVVNMTDTTETGILGRTSAHGSESGWSLWSYDNCNDFLSYSVLAGTYSPYFTDTRIAIVPNTWKTLIFSRDAANGLFKMWQNGTLMGQHACVNTFESTTRPVSMGSLLPTTNFGKFQILEAIVFNQALTDEEAAAVRQYVMLKYPSIG